MEGILRTQRQLQCPDVTVALVAQSSSGPLRRVHKLEQPSLVYLPANGSDRARGCFGAPTSHRSFLPFGTAVLVPARTELHVESPGFAARQIVICRYQPEQFSLVTGIDQKALQDTPELCVDINVEPVISFLSRISAETLRSSAGRDTVIAGLGLALLGELARYFDARRRTKPQQGLLADWQMKRISERLAEEERTVPKLPELAALCGTGPRNLMRKFRRTTGMTVQDRIDEVRFSRAQLMLTTTDRPIALVGYNAGFSTASGFSTAFARRFGETPSAFRMRNQAAGQR